jgi:hypothetical protein
LSASAAQIAEAKPKWLELSNPTPHHLIRLLHPNHQIFLILYAP